MEVRIEDEFEDWSLGFPAVLRNVPMAHVRGDVAPRVNSREFKHAVLWLLAHRLAPLSGRQVRYVRHWMQETLADFAELVGMTSHQSVMKWEAKAHEPTGMHKSTEILLRCRILEELPEAVWKRFNADEGGKASFVHRIEGVSSFERDAEPMTIELDAGELEEAHTDEDERPRA